MKSKKIKMNPAEALGKMQRAKMGIAVGSMLEGGGIIYNDGDPKKKKTAKLKQGQITDLDEVDADTSNLFTGAFSNIKARRYSKKNPGATGVSYKPSGGFRKRRKTTTFQDGEKGDIVRRLGI